MNVKGHAYIDVEPSLVAQIIGLMPSTYRVIGSDTSPTRVLFV